MRAVFLLLTLLFALVTPARATDDVAAAQGVIRSQEQAFGRDDAAARAGVTRAKSRVRSRKTARMMDSMLIPADLS